MPMEPIRRFHSVNLIPREVVLADGARSASLNDVSDVRQATIPFNHQPTSPATPPTEPDPSEVPISEMKAKAFTDEMARAKMEDVMKKLGLDKEELSKLSADLKKALDKINDSNKIDIAQKSVINDYLRAFVLHVAFYVDSKENPKKDTELKQDIKGFVETLSKMSNRSAKEVLDNCIWKGKGSLKKIMSKVTEKIVAENTENITPPERISFNEYRDSVATRLLLEYLLTNIIYPERARIMKEAGYDLDENKQGDPDYLFKKDVADTIKSLIGQEHLLKLVPAGLERVLCVSFAWKLLTTPAPGSEDPSESGTNSDGGGGAPLKRTQSLSAIPTHGPAGDEGKTSFKRSLSWPLFPEVPPGNLEEDGAKDSGKIPAWSAPRNSVEEEVQPDNSHSLVVPEQSKTPPRRPSVGNVSDLDSDDETFFDAASDDETFVDASDDELDGSSHDPEPAQRISGEVGEVEEGGASAVMPREPVTVLRPEEKRDETSTEVKNRIPHAEVKIPERLFSSAGSFSWKSQMNIPENQPRSPQFNGTPGGRVPTFASIYRRTEEGKWVLDQKIKKPLEKVEPPQPVYASAGSSSAFTYARLSPAKEGAQSNKT